MSLAELTLTQELRVLIGTLPGTDRRGWFDAYGRETAPLNARGLLVTVDGQPLTLAVDGFDLVVEEHPRFTFRFSAGLPNRGRLSFRDTNFASSEGTSRLAVRGSGVEIQGDDLPADVRDIPPRPVWQLTDEEERRTRQVVVTFQPKTSQIETIKQAAPETSSGTRTQEPTRLTGLLDSDARWPSWSLGLLAFVLGLAHAAQPGHGKTLVVATVIGERGGRGRGILLATLTTLVHTGSVFVVAAALWWSTSERFSQTHVVLTRLAGFLVAATGCWRVGRMLGGWPLHDEETAGAGPRGLFALALAGGIVPCWDAVALLAIAAAVGRLGLGGVLVVCFSLGMGLALVAVGWAAAGLRRLVEGRENGRWVRALGWSSGLALALMGLYLLGVAA